MPLENNLTDELVRRAIEGDERALQQLLEQHRSRLRRMVAVRMDPRLAARVDPSDVVQEALTDAARRMSGYIPSPAIPFYSWLRQIAWERLVDLYHQHITAQKRSVSREQPQPPGLPDQSALDLAQQLVASCSSPSQHLVRQELRQRVQDALNQLQPHDREVLVMRHLEQMQVSEIAAVLQLGEGAVKMRRLRAIERLRELLCNDLTENRQ